MLYLIPGTIQNKLINMGACAQLIFGSKNCLFLRYIVIAKRPLTAGQFASAHSGPASSCTKNSLPGSVGIKLEVTQVWGP